MMRSKSLRKFVSQNRTGDAAVFSVFFFLWFASDHIVSAQSHNALKNAIDRHFKAIYGVSMS